MMKNFNVDTLRSLARLFRFRFYPIPYLVRRYLYFTGSNYFTKKNSNYVCLDIGAGSSPYKSDILKHLNVTHYISFDIEASNQTSIVGDATLLPFKTGSIDVIVAFDTLQHIPHVSSSFNEIYRVIRPGGYLILSFPFAYGECDFIDFRRWSMNGMRDELEFHGFEFIHGQTRGGLFFSVAAFIHWWIQHVIPGARVSWRTKINKSSILRYLFISILTIPTAILGWLALAIDYYLPTSGIYMGGVMLARRPIYKSSQLNNSHGAGLDKVT